MNTILLTALGAAALLPAAPPNSPVPVLPAENPPVRGKVLVLTNGRTVEGDVERVGDRYRVCRDGGESWVPGTTVFRLCENSREAYLCLRARVHPTDLDGFLRVAEWCHEHGMDREAFEETQGVLKADSKYLQARLMLASLQARSGIAPASAPAPTLPAAPAPPQLDLTAETLTQFGIRVQPILMNACVSCHNDTRPTAFRLTRCDEIGIGNRRTLQQNVLAVLAFVKPDQPQASPFLTKAVSIHWWKQTPQGMILAAGDPTQAPFRNRHAPAFRALEEWVQLAIATTPQLAEVQAQALPAPEPRAVPVTPIRPDAPGPEVLPAPRRTAPEFMTPPPPVGAARPGQPPATPPAPDPYDVGEFNRRNHPERANTNEPPPRQ
jgi:hypothetical protein